MSSAAGGRSSGGHALHAGSEGVKVGGAAARQGFLGLGQHWPASLSGFQLLATVLSQKPVSDSSPGDSPVKPLEGPAGKGKDTALLAGHGGSPRAALAPSHPLVPRCDPGPASSGPRGAGLWGAATQEAGGGVRGQGTGPGRLQGRGPGKPAWLGHSTASAVGRSVLLSVCQSVCVAVVSCAGCVCKPVCLKV